MSQLNEIATALTRALSTKPDEGTPPGYALDVLHDAMDAYAKDPATHRTYQHLMNIPGFAKLWQAIGEAK